MKLARILFAIMAVVTFAACSADVTGPSSSTPSYDDGGQYGDTGGKP